MKPELLDDDLGTAAEVAASFADLKHINDWFGGTRTTVHLLARIARERKVDELSLLEIGAGTGHIPLSAQRILAKRGVEIRVTLLDRVLAHLPQNGVQAVAADAMQLPFRDNSFDVVSCCLFAHHFEPAPLAELAKEAFRVAGKAVLINDVIRSRTNLLLTYAGLPLFRSRITWHDAPASVRRAYTPTEIRDILKAVPANRIEVSQHYLYRMGVLLWK